MISTNGKLDRDYVAEVSFTVKAEDINGQTTHRQIGTGVLCLYLDWLWCNYCFWKFAYHNRIFKDKFISKFSMSLHMNLLMLQFAHFHSLAKPFYLNSRSLWWLMWLYFTAAVPFNGSSIFSTGDIISDPGCIFTQKAVSCLCVSENETRSTKVITRLLGNLYLCVNCTCCLRLNLNSLS